MTMAFISELDTKILTELSSEAVGGHVLSVSDEFFVEAFHLLKIQPAQSLKGQFGPKGALYSGWETRRHNPDHDWCIIRLGVPGSIHAFDIDTSHFNGNEAPAASVEALFTDESGSIEHNDARWTTVLPKVDLGPNSHHYLAALHDTRSMHFTHVKLSIYPDGGVARFRVYGLVLPTFPEDRSEIFDMALFSAGGRVVAVSDQHFGQGSNLVLPGRGKDMGDGWETKRSRAKGHTDWAILMLGCPGILDHIEIDTNHFMGNFPESTQVHATNSQMVVPESDSSWTEILPRIKLGPHRRHFFQLQKAESQAFTHIRVTIFPDGGIKRVRVMGRRANLITIGPFARVKSVEQEQDSTHGLTSQQPAKISVAEHLTALPLTHEAFAEYGSVIQAYVDINAAPREMVVSSANQGTAVKFGHTFAKVKASFPSDTTPTTGFAVYRAQPSPTLSSFTVKLLERHPYNNQAFFAIGSGARLWDNDLESPSSRYLVVVAKNGTDDRPDLSTLRAFVASTSQGVLYDTGTWHHPLIALESTADFACVETQLGGGSQLDCEVVGLEAPHFEIFIPDHSL